MFAKEAISIEDGQFVICGQKRISMKDVELRDFHDEGIKTATVKMTNEEYKTFLDSEIYLAICETNLLKQGSTRESLLKYYREEIELDIVGKQTFVHRISPLIKVDVEWNYTDERKRKKDDTIKFISQPYIEMPLKNNEYYIAKTSDIVSYFLMGQLGNVDNVKLEVTTRGELLGCSIREDNCSVSNAKQRFSLGGSRLLKLDIEFNLLSPNAKQDGDTIKTISKPYLAVTTENNFDGYKYWKGNVVKYLPECLAVLEKIRDGVKTRKDIEEHFRCGGGLTSNVITRYEFKKCENITVDVTFTVKDPQSIFSATDTVVKISEPYIIELPPQD
ncbi:MAG: hypothetical protein LBJ00_08285 [Planctomycetaceae bacterium]|nr:hypothetical protein [Planctomycetaceae bacterium]